MAEEWQDRRKPDPDVLRAQAAVLEASVKLENVAGMLRRHFTFLVTVAAIAIVVGLLLIFGVFSVRAAQSDVRRLAERTETQTVKNEVEVLRHRVHEREGHQRLCAIALGARLPADRAERICDPVLGGDLPQLRAELSLAERRLEAVTKGNR